ncbi:uncharacterized protein TNCV_1634831 [Trichonephila clavipes]|nr:uncharacterized protein TNCV_1634831 [Trichonephila clavipes]
MCLDQWIREMSFTRRPGSGCPRQPHRKKCKPTANCFIARHPETSSSFSRDPCVLSDRTKLLDERYLGSWRPLRELTLTCPPIDASVWSGSAHEETGLQQNGTMTSLTTNPDSISAVMTIVFVCRDPVVNV